MTTVTKLKPLNLSHKAYPTNDMQATHEFWTNVLGLDYIGALRYDGGWAVSSGDIAPDFIHTFYAMADGGCVAFFELGTQVEAHDDGWPKWTNHIAMNCSSHEELHEWERHFQSLGVAYDGEINHQNGLFYSLYVRDPNGIRIEITYMPNPLTEEDARQAVEILAKWNADKAAGLLK